jgi:ribose 1,5-bisphosphokinase PhnN
VTYHLVYLVGPPGVGKSSVMAALTADCDRLAALGPVPHDVLVRPNEDPDSDANIDVAVEIGRRRDAFSGTDALGMSIQPRAVEWIVTRPHRLVLAEGARLATAGFLHAARAAGYTVHLIHLDGQPTTLDARRAERDSHQAPSWVRGATTRAQRIMDRMAVDANLTWMHTDNLPPAEIASILRDNVPGLEVLR